MKVFITATKMCQMTVTSQTVIHTVRHVYFKKIFLNINLCSDLIDAENVEDEANLRY